MGEWKEYKLGEIGQVLDSKRIPLSSTQRAEKKGKYPYYGASGIIDYVDDYIFDGEYVLISEDGENLRTRQTPIAFIAKGKFWVNNHAHIVQADYIHNRLLCYFFANLDLNPYITGAVQPKLNQSALNSISIYLPDSIEERRGITGILSSLDDKIDLLGKQNATLEAMAETLFRQYFIENPNNVDDVQLGEVINTTSGGTPSRKNLEYYINGSIDWVKSKELLGTYIFETEERITKDALNNSSAKLIPENSVLIAMYGATVGEYGIISKEMTCNQAVCALIPNQNYPFTYLYLWAKYMQQEFINLACGAAQQNISQIVIKQQYVCGETNLIKKFHSIIFPYFAKLKNNQAQIRSLTKLRDTLLPKLMNNEIKICQ